MRIQKLVTRSLLASLLWTMMPRTRTRTKNKRRRQLRRLNAAGYQCERCVAPLATTLVQRLVGPVALLLKSVVMGGLTTRIKPAIFVCYSLGRQVGRNK
jgi:hypothetical protein